MMKTPALLAAASLASLLVLAACDKQSHTITADDDPQSEALKNAAPVEAPPMIQASKTYRCKDQSLLYVDSYTNNTVRVRAKKDGGEGTSLSSAAGQPPYTAEGYSLSGTGDQVSYTSPGKGTLSCHV
jgi:uncharacterized lipoprotein YajG